MASSPEIEVARFNGPLVMDALLAEMQAEVWTMEPKALTAFFRKITALRTVAFDGEPRAAIESRMKTEGRTAVIPIKGVLMKSVPWLFDLFGIEATAFSAILADLKTALGSEEIDSILFRVESPGGQVGGTEELGESIRAAGGEKPTAAFIEDIGASGAYWLASQAKTITANRNAMVGSIGVYTVYEDASKMAEKLGIEVKVIRSGEHKGMGVLGAPITEEQEAAVQDVVEGMAENFIAAVAKGRGKKQAEIKQVADGRVWIAKEALDLGLVDRIDNFESALASSEADIERKNDMADQDLKALKAARAEARAEALKEEKKRTSEIHAAFPDDGDFAMEQIAAGATLQEAKVAFCDVLQKRSVDQAAEIAKLRKGEGTPAKPRGAKPVEHGTPDEGEGTFWEQARALQEEKDIPMIEAMRRVARKNPELYQEHKATEDAGPRRR